MKPYIIRTLPVYLFIFLFFSGYSNVSAQSVSLRDELLKITKLSDSLTNARPTEKLYLQFDKPYYALGDTIWFKAYLLNAGLAASAQSGILYLDIAADSGKVIKQYSVPVQGGLSWGNISLDEKDFKTGTYTIRAYTKWMLNFGDDYFFTKSFYIASTGEGNWLVNKQLSTATVNGANVANVKLQFNNMNKMPAANQLLHLKVTAAQKHLYKQAIQTDKNGLLDVNFKIPEKSQGLAIIAETEDKKAIIPLPLNRIENADIQFLPEGGNLVAGLPAHIGFKAIDEDGKGIDISGIITDKAGTQVAVFRSSHNGMGSFDLTVQSGGSYTAKVALPGGGVKEYALPPAKNAGTTLRINNRMESDSIDVFMAGTDDVVQSGENFFLIGRARGIVCYAAIFNFNNGNAVKSKIAKSLFPSGIAQFTLMNTKYQPLNERLVYIAQNDNLNINITPNKPEYTGRDSVALHLKVTDNTGRPVAANFSLAVTDDAQIGIDSLRNENIITRLLLSANLKGYIEDAGYYLQSKNGEVWQALDNLLLTQGWIGYDWKEVFSPPAINYQPETDFAVKGHVINLFNKPVKASEVLLFSKSPGILMDTITDKYGKFVFSHFHRVDTPIFIIRALNKNGRSFNVGVTVDQIKPPPFTNINTLAITPWYINSDSTLLNYTKNKAFLTQQDYHAQGKSLKEVKILAKKIIKDSKNMNGPGNADLVLDEKDLEAAGKKNLLQLLEEKIPGFREGNAGGGMMWKFIQDIKQPDLVGGGPFAWYCVHDKPIKIYVDGISVTDIFPADYPAVLAGTVGFLNMNNYLKLTTAEDIKGVELNRSTKYAMAYIPAEYNYDVHPSDMAFIEITTRGGHGPDVGNTPGIYLYKPLALSWPKQFYKPGYAVKDTANHKTDLRSTIDWEPNIITNKNGEATFSFYTADKPSSYTIIINGADMNGNLGFKTGKIRVINMDSPKEKSK